MEFTDEEEKQRDEEEAKFEAEKPIREAERRKEREAAKQLRESFKYDIRIIAFLDILGWADKVKCSENDTELAKELGCILTGIQHHQGLIKRKTEKNFPGDLRMTHFSVMV